MKVQSVRRRVLYGNRGSNSPFSGGVRTQGCFLLAVAKWAGFGRGGNHMSAHQVGYGPSNSEATAANDLPQGCLHVTVGSTSPRSVFGFGFTFAHGSFSNQLRSHRVALVGLGFSTARCVRRPHKVSTETGSPMPRSVREVPSSSPFREVR